ncbi:3-oxoacyl-[acyl-carrier-protein] synthase 3 [Pirellulimonas nuda]|uniref:3-oxoacyl-[acyl-carrier-protein] synthase 3 n=1 Tax=Pirellulimonas nuda TaxID=2528009 RepID=A0A518DH41_9BACT|nr:3-oxoacyl-ACP synthase III [Pirellulimonas nuda]QDU90786.1 3-oxoacyl-[acyl-carrier-protein] synthase 3 [Pirellulimonas nuda]
MRFSRVCLEGLGHVLPEQRVTSAEIETRLGPLYRRLRLPEGRLELMTGIGERRFFPPGARPGDLAIEAGRRALRSSGVPIEKLGVLIHGSVCRDHLEPATACRVHHALGLPRRGLAFDVSNACLGILTGALQIASMIELGQVEAGIVVGAECGRPLVDNTIERLNTDETLSRDTIKRSVASLTIGSAAAALVLCDASLSRTGRRLTSAAATAATEDHDLCQSEGLQQVMQTDSEKLMRRGVAAGAETFEHFLAEAGWRRDQIDLSVCHQVGVAHRRMMLGALGLPEERDFATVETLGNTGSAALPTTLSLAVDAGRVAPGDRVAMLGIGSGINCLMMGVQWGA